jgi:hypothetical protein
MSPLLSLIIVYICITQEKIKICTPFGLVGAG